MDKPEEISQWASKVIGRSSVYQGNEAQHGAHLCLGPVGNGQHGTWGWVSATSSDEWIELAFENAVTPKSFEIFCWSGAPYPTKIFGRGTANELIELYNKPGIIMAKNNVEGFKFDLIQVQIPMSQFRFEVPNGGGYAHFWALKLTGMFSNPEIQRLRREKPLLDQTLASNQSTIDQLNDNINTNNKSLVDQAATLQALGLEDGMVGRDEAAAKEITILQSTVKQLTVEKEQLLATIQQLKGATEKNTATTAVQHQENALIEQLQSEIDSKRKQTVTQRDVIMNLQAEISKQEQRLALNSARIKTAKDDRDIAFRNLQAQFAACQASKAQIEQDFKKHQDESNRYIQDIRAQLAASQAAKAQIEHESKALQAKLTDLQRKLDQQSIQDVMSNINNATTQDILTLASVLQVDVTAVQVDKLAVSHMLAFESFRDYFHDSEAEPQQHDALLKLYSTIKTAKDTRQLPSNDLVSAWINKQPRHHDESTAKKIEEAALRFDEKGYTETMLIHLDCHTAALILGIKFPLLSSLQKDLIASQCGVHLLEMHE